VIFGVQTFGDSVDPTVIARMGQARTRFVRLPIHWQYIEPFDVAPAHYGFGGVDTAVAPLAGADLDLIGVVFGRPTWAATTDCGPIDKVPLARYQAYLGALVEHYDGDGVADAPGSPRIAYWEIENEQDFDRSRSGGVASHGSCFGGGDAMHYAAQLRAAYLAIKAADPEATVLFGGLAHDRFYNKSGYSPTGPFDYAFAKNALKWLQANHGGEPEWPFFDWMTLHVYNDYRNNWDGAQPYRQELSAKLAHFRLNQLVQGGQYDLRSIPIALTEASLASLPGDAFTGRSEALQAAYPGQLLARAMAEGAPAVAWFIMEDRFTGPCTSIYDWITVGLLRSLEVYQKAQACGSSNPIPSYQVGQDHEPKPAFDAFLTAQDQLGGTIFVNALTSAQTGSNQIEAYRLYRPGEGYRIVAFTDNGERLGRIGSPPLTRNMTFNASKLPFWTGKLAATNHLGVTTHHEGSSIILQIRQEPIYVRPE
jgi:hypothetical protein